MTLVALGQFLRPFPYGMKGIEDTAEREIVFAFVDILSVLSLCCAYKWDRLCGSQKDLSATWRQLLP